ncbi:aldo/keto reductase [Streptomyces sp. A1-5]|uniref:aldo/keto reductase n=1 Tax=Streptomyces sp. A1-5 TaxID=2738410 RepID=UPI001F3461FD|nr:aldo/keto reductase [Streptomyces sp. A1-5]
MRRVTLGTNGPEVGVQGLGCMGMNEFYGEIRGTATRAESLAVMSRALELGVTLFDTADAYGLGANEELLGSFLKLGHRDQVVTATKFGLVPAVDTPGRRRIRGDAAYVRQACEASLRRLGVETIDLYYMHRRDIHIPIEETVGAMAELVAAGKIRYLGMSEATAAELRAATAVHPIAVLQSEWSLFSRDIEDGPVQAARELGVALVPYSPLGRGLLTGFFRSTDDLPAGDLRRSHPRFMGRNARINVALLAPVRSLARAHAATPAQIALAWVQHRADSWGLTVVPVPGSQVVREVEENAAAADLKLNAEELAALEPLAARVAGDRYADMSHTSARRT